MEIDNPDSAMSEGVLIGPCQPSKLEPEIQGENDVPRDNRIPRDAEIQRENARLWKCLTRGERRQLGHMGMWKTKGNAYEKNSSLKAMMEVSQRQSRANHNAMTLGTQNRNSTIDSQVQFLLANPSIQSTARAQESSWANELERRESVSRAKRERKALARAAKLQARLQVGPEKDSKTKPKKVIKAQTNKVENPGTERIARLRKQKPRKRPDPQNTWERQIAGQCRWKTPNRALLFWAAVQLQFFHNHFEFGIHQTVDNIAHNVVQLLEGDVASWDLFHIKPDQKCLRKMGIRFAPKVRSTHGRALSDPNARPGNPDYAKEQSEIAYVLIKEYARELPPDSAAAVLKWNHIKLKNIGARFGGIEHFSTAITNGFLEDDQRMGMASPEQQIALELLQSSGIHPSSSFHPNNTVTQLPTNLQVGHIKLPNMNNEQLYFDFNQAYLNGDDKLKDNDDAESDPDFLDDNDGNGDNEEGGVALMSAYDAASADLQRHMAKMTMQDHEQQQ